MTKKMLETIELDNYINDKMRLYFFSFVLLDCSRQITRFVNDYVWSDIDVLQSYVIRKNLKDYIVEVYQTKDQNIFITGVSLLNDPPETIITTKNGIMIENAEMLKRIIEARKHY